MQQKKIPLNIAKAFLSRTIKLAKYPGGSEGCTFILFISLKHSYFMITRFAINSN